MTADELAAALGEEAAHELASALDRIKHCLDQLSDEQIWWRNSPEENSIGNLVLHLCGNVRQWIVGGLGGAADIRDRPAEFSQRGPIARAELLQKLEAVVQQAWSVLKQQKAEELLKMRRIQGQDVTGLKALFDSVPHFRGHTQEIIHITRALCGPAYKFAWQPLE
jgi:uncharacterized damage-inducible protein DinB